MSPDPVVPPRLHDLVEAFAHTAQAVVDLAHACSDDDLSRPTECPGWTVHDQISHVVGVEAWLEGHKDPRVEMPQYDHIRNDLGKKIEYAVELRRGRTGADVLAELEDVLAQRLSTLRSPDLTDTSVITGPFGPDQAATVMLLRTFDVWAHEQDIRSALGRPGDLDSPAAAVFVSTVMAQLPNLVAKSTALEPGHTVVLDVTGPGPVVAARQGVRVEVDEQGRLRGHALSADALPAEAVQADAVPADRVPASNPRTEPQVTTITLSTEAFTRRAAGRRSVSETEYSVVGDDAVARRVLEALVVTH
jgi:uncharacterized protein (TIGR03083 family)